MRWHRRQCTLANVKSQWLRFCCEPFFLSVPSRRQRIFAQHIHTYICCTCECEWWLVDRVWWWWLMCARDRSAVERVCVVIMVDYRVLTLRAARQTPFTRPRRSVDEPHRLYCIYLSALRHSYICHMHWTANAQSNFGHAKYNINIRKPEYNTSYHRHTCSLNTFAIKREQ